MIDKIGGGERIVFDSRLVVTGTSKVLSSTFEVLNSTNFPLLTFTPYMCPCFLWNSSLGEFEFQTSGVLTMAAAINISALQASAELQMVPQFNFGSGWVPGVPRKEIFVAIEERQLTWTGDVSITKGTKLRFWFSGLLGNLQFKSEIIDSGGPLESIMPAAVMYVNLFRKVLHRYK